MGIFKIIDKSSKILLLFDKNLIAAAEEVPNILKNIWGIFSGCFSKTLKNILSKKNQGPVCILIGPEGDFSEKERQLIIEKKEIFSLSLANNVLRAETAAIAAVTIVNYHLNFN